MIDSPRPVTPASVWISISEAVRETAWGESYFDPNEMQQDGERYDTLCNVLRDRWGDGVMGLLLLDCRVVERGLGLGALILGETATAQESVPSK